MPANMIPETFRFTGRGGEGAEKVLFEALRDGLDEEWFVFHSFHYVEPGAAREGEIDFLAVHRLHGMLGIECKGRGVKRRGTGEWVRIWEGREEVLGKSPFAQVEGHVHELVKTIQPHFDRMFPQRKGSFPLVYGHGAAFPFTILAALNLPAEVQRELVLDADRLPDVGAFVNEALRFWRGKYRMPEPLSQKDFRRFRRQILYPKLNLVPTLGGRMKAAEGTFVRLAAEQARALEMFLDNGRLEITGGAGTGKTLLAVEAARLLAQQGHKVLFVCYTRALSEFVEETAVSWGLEDGAVLARNFHRLCTWAYMLLDEPFEPPPKKDLEASARFWGEEAPFTLCRALDAGKLAPWDAVVVDEGQDFVSTWWDVTFDCLADRATSPLVVCHDPAQEIFGRGNCVPDVGPRMHLKRNYRNTRRIAEEVARLGQTDTVPHPDCPEGDRPSRYPMESPAKLVDKVTQLLDRLTGAEQVDPERIVILTPHTRENSSLAGLEALGGHVLADKPYDRDGRVLHCSIGAFKGLESDVVILLDVDPADERCNPAALYVAESRARKMLYVFGG